MNARHEAEASIAWAERRIVGVLRQAPGWIRYNETRNPKPLMPREAARQAVALLMGLCNDIDAAKAKMEVAQ